MQRCRAWLRLHGITSTCNHAGPARHDGEPPPYHDLGTTTGPAADIASITSAISTVAIVTRSDLLSTKTTELVELISRMGQAIATTPHARDYHRWYKPEDGHRICVTGTAEALMTGIDSYVDIVLMQLAQGDHLYSWPAWGFRSRTLERINDKTLHSPFAPAITVAKNLHKLCYGIQGILESVQPVACAPAVAAVIISALANVARAVAAAPEESMPATAELYASYAERAAHGIVGGIIDAQSLRDGRAPATSTTTSHFSGSWSRSSTESSETEDTAKRPKKRMQRRGPMTRKNRWWDCDCTPIHL